MATKAAKSLTINATKFELANDLAVVNGKLQLKAKDVVLAEVDIPTKFAGFKIDVDNNTVEVVELSDGNDMQRTASATSQPVTITPAQFIERVNSYVGFESGVKRPNESIFTDSMKTWVATGTTGFTVTFYQLDGANGFAVYDTATNAWTIIYNP